MIRKQSLSGREMEILDEDQNAEARGQGIEGRGQREQTPWLLVSEAKGENKSNSKSEGKFKGNNEGKGRSKGRSRGRGRGRGSGKRAEFVGHFFSACFECYTDVFMMLHMLCPLQIS
jgi:hypothetical protein